MITRLIWTTWTSMSTVPQKAVKLNRSLTHSLRLSDAYMRHQSKCLSPIPYLNQCCIIVTWTLSDKLQLNIIRNANIFIQDNAFVNVVWNTSAILSWLQCVKCFWSCDAIWQHRSGSTLNQVIACYLTAPGHYLNQCWLTISEVLWHSSEGDFTGNS